MHYKYKCKNVKLSQIWSAEMERYMCTRGPTNPVYMLQWYSRSRVKVLYEGLIIKTRRYSVVLLVSNAIITMKKLLSIDQISSADLGIQIYLYITSSQWGDIKYLKRSKVMIPCTKYLYERWPVMFWIFSMYLLRSKASEHELKYKYLMSPAERWRSFKLTFISDGDLSNMCLNIQLLACAASGKLALAFFSLFYTVLSEEYFTFSSAK